MKHKLPTILTIIVVGLGVLFVIGLRVVDATREGPAPLFPCFL